MKVSTPLYRDLRKELAARMADGRYAKGQAMPREIDLCAEFAVSRNTVRAALSELASQGMIRRVKKLGTIVESSRPRASYAMDMSAMEGLRRYVRSTRLTVVDQRAASLPEQLVDVVGTKYARGWLLIRTIRHYGSEGPPVAGLDLYLREKYAAVAGQYGKNKGMLYEAVEEMFGVTVERFDVRIRAAAVGSRWAGLLECSRSKPAINMTEIVYASGDDIVEVGSMVMPENGIQLAYSVAAPHRTAPQ